MVLFKSLFLLLSMTCALTKSAVPYFSHKARVGDIIDDLIDGTYHFVVDAYYEVADNGYYSP